MLAGMLAGAGWQGIQGTAGRHGIPGTAGRHGIPGTAGRQGIPGTALCSGRKVLLLYIKKGYSSTLLILIYKNGLFKYTFNSYTGNFYI